MKSLLEVLTLSTEYLQKKGIPHARRQAEELVGDALGLDRVQLYVNFERPLTDDELSICRQRLGRRAQGEPLQYIRGEVDFYYCSFLVDPSVLIPRQETEILVDTIAQQLSKMDLKDKSLWDVCCGSGCMGISLKKEFPELRVTLSDISTAALELAQRNAERNGVQVEFVQGDLLAPFAGQKTDFLVCNPPYIAEGEYSTLDREVRDHEPRGALVGGPLGTEFYARLAVELPSHLNPSSMVCFEMGHSQRTALRKLFPSAHFEKDWSGHDRFCFLKT